MPITAKPAEYYGHLFITRKVITGFMDWLSRRVFVERFDENGLIYRYIQVPVQFSTRERFMTILRAKNQRHEFNEESGVTIDLNRILPRMSVNILVLTYDGERMTAKTNKLRALTYNEATNTLVRMPIPVPYNLEIEVTLISKSMDDNFQMIEQILPYFNPTMTLDMNLVPDFEPQSVGFSISAITPDIAEELGIDEERIFLTALTFSTKLQYPFYKSADSDETIKQIIANFHVGKGEGADETFLRFKQYQLDAVNPSPVTTVAERATEPVTITVHETIFDPSYSDDFV